jgi:hypothetical protein
MNRTYYTLLAHLLPGWKLPHAKSLKVEDKELKGGTSRRPVDTGQWPDPPHVYFANLGYDSARRGGVASEQEIVKFTTRYGPLGVEQGKDAATQPEEPFWLTLDTFRFFQAQLREAWTKRKVDLFTDPQNLGAGLGYELLPVNWKVKNDHLEMRPASCYAYMGILLARDLAEGRAKVCQNPYCSAPYFVAKRRDAKFCSHPCAVAVNVKKFRQRQRRKK